MSKFIATLTMTAATMTACLMANPVQAQVAEVPGATAQGDFKSAKVLGNRGYYQNKSWLVVDTSSGLNCRATPNGTVKSVLMPGSVVSAVFAGQGNDAIAFHQGSPWLRVTPQIPAYGSGTAGTCYVRANVRYIAPISQDFIYNGKVSLGR